MTTIQTETSHTNTTRCIASRERQTIIDVLRPDGLTACFGRDLADVRREYPDAYETTVDEFCAWKAERQRTPITWAECSEDEFIRMLEVLPPAAGTRGYRSFLVGEAYDHDAGTGEPRFQAYRVEGKAEKFLRASRPMTVREWNREVAA